MAAAGQQPGGAAVQIYLYSFLGPYINSCGGGRAATWGCWRSTASGCPATAPGRAASSRSPPRKVRQARRRRHGPSRSMPSGPAQVLAAQGAAGTAATARRLPARTLPALDAAQERYHVQRVIEGRRLVSSRRARALPALDAAQPTDKIRAREAVQVLAVCSYHKQRGCAQSGAAALQRRVAAALQRHVSDSKLS